MAVSPVSNASGSGTSGTASVTRGTVSDGDLMFLYLLCSDPTATPTDPAGWTRVGTNQSDTTATADCVAALYRRVASGEPASYSITLAIGTAGWSLLHLAFSGQDATTPLNASNQSGDTALSTHVTASITPTVANCLIVSFFGLDGAVASPNPYWTPTAPAAELVEVTGGSDTHQGVNTEQQTTAAAVTHTDVGGDTDAAAMYIIAIAPSTAAVPYVIPPDPYYVAKRA
jgi:hypothetical protein